MSLVGMANPIYRNNLQVMPFDDYVDGEGGMDVGGKYRTKKFNTKKKAKKLFVNVLTRKGYNRGYTKKEADELFAHEERKKRTLTSLSGHYLKHKPKKSNKNVKKYTVKDLRLLAKHLGIKLPSRILKKELMKLVGLRGKHGGLIEDEFDEGGIIVGGKKTRAHRKPTPRNLFIGKMMKKGHSMAEANKMWKAKH